MNVVIFLLIVVDLCPISTGQLIRCSEYENKDGCITSCLCIYCPSEDKCKNRGNRCIGDLIDSECKSIGVVGNVLTVIFAALIVFLAVIFAALCVYSLCESCIIKLTDEVYDRCTRAYHKMMDTHFTFNKHETSDEEDKESSAYHEDDSL